MAVLFIFVFVLILIIMMLFFLGGFGRAKGCALGKAGNVIIVSLFIRAVDMQNETAGRRVK